MVAYLSWLFFHKFLGFHWHEWSRWNKTTVTDEHGYNETMQYRKCNECGLVETKSIY